ncbi:MAG: OmpA family protein [Nitrospinae bacterium]|nr:OmpA family protein [Nitrospinota bacterium]
MAEKDEKPKLIIIKRIKKKHAGAHGGSWKVAYADFVTAMMALFLLLWLLSMVSPEKKVILADFFKHFSVFEHGQSFMEGQQYPIKHEGAKVGEVKYMYVSGLMEIPLDKLKAKVEEAVQTKLSAGAKEHVFMEASEGGLRIQIVDRAGSQIFAMGSDKPTQIARDIIKVVGESLKDMPNQIVIEGHTDANPFRSGEITNWELSTSRASAARRELEASGIEPSRFDHVVGYADKELLVKEDPYDPRNRRISLLVKPIPAGTAQTVAIPPGVQGPVFAAPPKKKVEPERIEPIDKGKLIGELGAKPEKPEFLKER